MNVELDETQQVELIVMCQTRKNSNIEYMQRVEKVESYSEDEKTYFRNTYTETINRMDSLLKLLQL